MQPTVTIRMFAPALVAGDERLAHLVTRIEEIVPEHPLAYALDETGFHPVTDRAGHLHTEFEREVSALLASRDPRDQILVNLMLHDLPHEIAPGRVHLLKISLRVRTSSLLPRVPALLGAVGDAARANTGEAIPSSAGDLCDPASEVSLRLPALADWRDLASPAVPTMLAWVSYWSDEACRLIGFDGTPAPWFYQATRYPRGWLVQLTEAPLDVSRPDHVEILRAAYAALPEVGRFTG